MGTWLAQKASLRASGVWFPRDDRYRRGPLVPDVVGHRERSPEKRVGSASMRGFEDFDRYLAEHDIPEEEYPEAFARWLGQQTGGQPVRFEKVKPEDEQILPTREQRELDGVPSFLAPQDDED
jgi:hypothetical protein